MHPEIGQELFDYAHLKEDTIVVVKAPGHKDYLTVRVMEANGLGVVFHSYILGWSVVNTINPEGQLIDGQGRIVHIYEYLGKE
jgi:hypothetical protein